MQFSIISVAVIGPAASGKTALIDNFIRARDAFVSEYIPTLGIDFDCCILQLPQQVKLQLWDCAGQVRYWPLVQSYLRKRNAIVCVFDISSLESFHACRALLEDCIKLKDANTFIVLVGNKVPFAHMPDILNRQEVSASAISELCNEFDAKYVRMTNEKECAASMFREIAIRALPHAKPPRFQPDVPIKFQKPGPCCFM